MECDDHGPVRLLSGWPGPGAAVRRVGEKEAGNVRP
jgi:hypothetical protein